MTKVVISQPNFFPWVGMFEQIRLCDIYVHYDDVQFSKGSFVNRVQIKCPDSVRWMTLPLAKLHLGQRINEVLIDQRQDWRQRHRELLTQAYRDTPSFDDMMQLVSHVYGAKMSSPPTSLCELAVKSLETTIAYFDLCPATTFLTSSKLGIAGSSSQRVLDVVKAVGGDVYITGHGASRYLDHEMFEANGVAVEYINYQKRPYPQGYGEFTPYVTTLDLVANVGRAGREWFCSGTMPWREFLAAQSATPSSPQSNLSK